MKKFMAMVIALALSTSMTAYADMAGNTAGETGNTAAVAEIDIIPSENTEIQCDGAWEAVKGDTSIEGNLDAKAAFDKATVCLTGASYEPVAVLAKQVVAGMNYCLLCKVTATTPDAKTQYQLLYINEDLQGIAEITGRKTLIGDETLSGGFEANTGDTSIYDSSNSAVKAAFNKTVETICGVDYEPVAYLGNQVVSGTNYLFLCRTLVLVPDAEPKFELVTIYEDLSGNTDLNGVVPVDFGEIDKPSSESGESGESGETTDPGTGMPNPWTDYASLKKAANAAGLTSFAAPARLGGKKACSLRAQKGIVEVGYGSNDENIFFRKGSGKRDVSGDHHKYPRTAKMEISGLPVIMRGANSTVYNMVWYDGTYSYSFYVASGVSANIARKLVASLIAANK